MAVVQWIEKLDSASIADVFDPLIEALGLELVGLARRDLQLFAVTPLARAPLLRSARVSVLVIWSDRRAHEVHIEVRSDEPMIRAGTSCEQVAQQLRQLLRGPQEAASMAAAIAPDLEPYRCAAHGL